MSKSTHSGRTEAASALKIAFLPTLRRRIISVHVAQEVVKKLEAQQKCQYKLIPLAKYRSYDQLKSKILGEVVFQIVHEEC